MTSTASKPASPAEIRAMRASLHKASQTRQDARRRASRERSVRIMSLVAAGKSQRQIAEITGINRGTVWDTIQRARREEEAYAPKPVLHGTESGYKRHIRMGEIACLDCQEAENRRCREWRAKKTLERWPLGAVVERRGHKKPYFKGEIVGHVYLPERRCFVMVVRMPAGEEIHADPRGTVLVSTP